MIETAKPSTYNPDAMIDRPEQGQMRTKSGGGITKCCENCRHLVRLKHDFKVGEGYKNSWVCVALIDTEPIQERDKYTFAVEVSKESDMCEMWQRKSF